MSTLNELLWALIGLLLTIGGTFREAIIAMPVFDSGHLSFQTLPLRVTYQVGAVLLVGCLGGRNSAMFSQIAYLALGLTWFNIFAQGGGLGYIQQPTFGYLLGFIPGAWVCGHLAFRAAPRLEALAVSCLAGLCSIHAMGIGFLLVSYPVGWLQTEKSLLDLLLFYSWGPLLGQLAVLCAVVLVAFTLRQVMFY